MVPKESMIPRTKRTGIKFLILQKYDFVVEPLIEFERNTHIILLVSPKEHTTDPENMVYTWFDNYIFIIINYCPS